MATIELAGLVGSNPLGAMASFGLLRILSETGDAKLSFVERDDWIATIACEHQSLEALCAHLSSWFRERPTSDLDWTEDDVRVTPDALRKAIAGATADDARLASFLTAFATDGAVDKSKGLAKPSQFFMASGQQSFLDTFRKLRGRLQTAGDAAWREALGGPWTYSVPEWCAGWDPGSERMHALRHQAPTRDKTSCVAAAVWLAYEALPFFPTFAVAGRERTVGFLMRDGESHWRWPLPTRSITRDALSALLSSAEVMLGEHPLRAGVGAIYESTRSTFGQGYAVFRPARRVV